MERNNQPPHIHGRPVVVALCVVAALILGVLVAARFAGLRINTTDSMPRGLWRVEQDKPIERGDIVAICPPENRVIREATGRGYIPVGDCPGGYEPLVKPVAAVGGDVVTVAPDGIAVNDKSIENTAQLARDSADRPLHPMPAGTYRVESGQLWLLSGHDPRSFDSRYFGPMPVSSVQAVARPVWVIP
jgi:conjugative transfer signal peptidase TraF